MDLDAVVLVKPDAFERMDTTAIENAMKADQRVLSRLGDLIVVGVEQLKAKTGYTNENLPDESPKRTPPFTLDKIDFYLTTDVRVNNPEYQPVFDKITGFLEVLVNDWEQGVRRDNVRTYSAKVVMEGNETLEKAPFIEWNYLMWSVYWYLSRATELGVTNEIEKIVAPKELDKMTLNTLVVPFNLIKDFNIEKPGATKLWYLARRFYKDVEATAEKPVKEEMVQRSGITKEEIPTETTSYYEQFDKYMPKVMSIPSPRRQPGKIIARLYKVPRKRKPQGSTALPVVVGPDNFIELLEAYRDTLPTSLKKWKNLEGNIGELVVFHYGIENETKVQQQFPFLPQYQLKRDGDKMFVYIQALYDRMKALEKDYIKGRLLRKHSVVPII